MFAQIFVLESGFDLFRRWGFGKKIQQLLHVGVRVERPGVFFFKQAESRFALADFTASRTHFRSGQYQDRLALFDLISRFDERLLDDTVHRRPQFDFLGRVIGDRSRHRFVGLEILNTDNFDLQPGGRQFFIGQCDLTRFRRSLRLDDFRFAFGMLLARKQKMASPETK